MPNKGRTVEEVVKTIIENQCGGLGKEWDLSWRLIDDCGADSLDTIEIVMAVEDEFGIEISDEKAEQMITGWDIVNYVRSL